MYVWKCWRDSRSRFIASAITLVALCVFFTYMEAKLGFGPMHAGPPVGDDSCVVNGHELCSRNGGFPFHSPLGIGHGGIGPG